MVKTTRKSSLACVAAIVLATTPSVAAMTAKQSGPQRTEEMIHVASRCIGHMKAYRQAIAFLDKRLEKSPAAVTFELSGGDSITLHNRVHTLMRFEKRVLEAGMDARERSCVTALMG